MSDKRSHRDQARHRGVDPFEQDFPVIRPAPRKESQTASIRETPSVKGTVKWFNADKGFGFVSLETGGEAFIHVSRLKAAGYGDPSEGTSITVRIGPGKKGPEVAEVVELGAGALRRDERTSRASPATEEVDAIGFVKWFNPGKGFGFVAVGDRQKDVFVSARVLQHAGLNNLPEGKRVSMKVVVGPKGPEARSIQIID
jgi:CspA family cold shock protein